MEFGWLRHIDFYPPKPGGLAPGASICVATKSRNLGDALALTTLPAKLRARFPGVRIHTYPRGFNAAVFRGNPHVSGVRRLPSAVFGDDSNWGEGQLIQLKEQYFDLPASAPPRPELHLLPNERAWATRMLARFRLPVNEGKPLCLLHPWGSTRRNVAPVEFWDRLVARWSGEFRFWQVGLEGQGAVQGCEYYLLLPPRTASVRRLFAVASLADTFAGVDSGPMHVARAFNLPSLVLLDHGDPAEIFASRRAPYFLHQNWRYSALYAENTHVRVAGEPDNSPIDSFFAAQAARFL